MTKFITLLIAAAIAVPAIAQSTDAVFQDKITSAVMKVYDDHLAENPNDYNVIFARAHQHYYDGDYTAALADVNQALLLTPKTDKELRFDEYILRARISEARMDYSSELADLRMAQELQPKSLACTDLIAKANLKCGNYDAAEKAFKTILRAESMNYDAMYGMAQVEAARGNGKAALAQVNKAVELFRVEPQVFINRADIQAKLGDINAAVQDLLQGMTVGDGGNAARSLFDLSDTHYDGVMSALALLADRSTDGGGLYRYLRANIALDHARYGQALSDLNYIRRGHLYDSPMMLYNMAKCYLELGRYDEALARVNEAISRDNTQPEFYVLKSLAEYNAGDGGNFDAAMATLNNCSSISPQFVPMLITKASLLSSRGKDTDALGYLNAAVANDPSDAEALIARALTLKRLDKLNLAVKDLNTMTRFGNDVYDFKGIALSELGRDNDALSWLNAITSTDVPGGENFFYAAVFMAMRGDNFKAMEYAQKAVDLGFSSRYRLQYDELSPLNLKKLRDEPGFQLLMDKAMRNFVEAN